MRTLAERALIILLLINFFYVLSGVFQYPLRSIDVFGIWLFKAKAFYVEKGFPLKTLTNSQYQYSHLEYPLLLPFVFSKIYELVNGVHEVYVLLLYPFVYLLILWLSYKIFLLNRISKPLSLLLTYVYSMFSPLLAQAGRMHAGTADIWLVLINWIALYVLCKNKQEKLSSAGWIIMILVMISSQVKLEGLFLASLLIFLSTSLRQRCLWLVFSALPFIIWQLIKTKLNIPASLPFALVNLNKLAASFLIITRGTVKEMLNLKNWYIFWPILVLLCFVQPFKSSLVKKVILPTLLLMIGLFFTVYLFAITETAAHVSSSIDRVMFQLSPFYYLIFAHLIVKLISSLSTKSNPSQR